MKAIIADSEENINHINEMIKGGHKVDFIGRNSNGVIIHFKEVNCIIHSWDFNRTVCMVCGVKHKSSKRSYVEH